MAGITAPVVGSGELPTWTALVEKLYEDIVDVWVFYDIEKRSRVLVHEIVFIRMNIFIYLSGFLISL